MTKEDFEAALQSAVEQLYEDESLRGDLTDEEAQVLLTWAENWLTAKMEQRYKDGPYNGVDATLERYRQTLKNAADVIQRATDTSLNVEQLDPGLRREIAAALRLLPIPKRTYTIGRYPYQTAAMFLVARFENRTRLDRLKMMVEALRVEPTANVAAQPATSATGPTPAAQ